MPIAMSPDVMTRCLGAVPLFAVLPRADLDRLAAAARSVAFRKGARIFEEGAVADCCFVLTAGRARVVLAGSAGAEILLNIVTPPALVGEIGMLDRSTRSASLVAAEPCHLIRIAAAAFEALRANRAFEDRLISGLISTVRRSDDRVRVISSFPTVKRVAWCLARIADASGHREGSHIALPRTSHQELAEMAGCTRETVTRALQVLRTRRYVTADRGALRIAVEPMQRYLTTELTVPARSEG